MLSRESVTDFPALLRQRIADALTYRERVVRNTDACRLVFSEGGLPAGLIVDRYNDVLSFQILTQAMDAESVRGTWSPSWWRISNPAGISERVDAHPRPGTVAGAKPRPG